jgi:hypothetical protein
MLADYHWCLRDSSAQRYINPRRIWCRSRGLRPLSRWPRVRRRRYLRISSLGLPRDGKGFVLNLQSGSVAVARTLLVEFHAPRAGRQLESALLFRLSTGLAACRWLATIYHIGSVGCYRLCRLFTGASKATWRTNSMTRRPSSQSYDKIKGGVRCQGIVAYMLFYDEGGADTTD